MASSALPQGQESRKHRREAGPAGKVSGDQPRVHIVHCGMISSNLISVVQGDLCTSNLLTIKIFSGYVEL